MCTSNGKGIAQIIEAATFAGPNICLVPRALRINLQIRENVKSLLISI